MEPFSEGRPGREVRADHPPDRQALDQGAGPGRVNPVPHKCTHLRGPGECFGR